MKWAKSINKILCPESEKFRETQHDNICDSCSNEMCKQALKIGNDDNQTTFKASYYSESTRLLRTEIINARPFILRPEHLHSQIKKMIMTSVKDSITRRVFKKAELTSVVVVENTAKTIKYEWQIGEIMTFADASKE